MDCVELSGAWWEMVGGIEMTCRLPGWSAAMGVVKVIVLADILRDGWILFAGNIFNKILSITLIRFYQV